jgi:hypothetical protein
VNIFSVVIGGIITIITAIFVENMRRPRLKLKIIEPLDITYKNRPANHTKYLLIGVENENLPSFVRWMSRNAALQCHGTISFHHLEDGQNVFGRAMDIRWSSAPEPVPIRIDYNGHHLEFFDHHRFQASQRIDIYPGDKNEFAAVAKFDNEQECWGWNNESYFCKNTWRNDKWKLDKGRYLIKVTIYSSGENVSKVFRLINDVSINDYRLMPATDEDKEKIRG